MSSVVVVEVVGTWTSRSCRSSQTSSSQASRRKAVGKKVVVEVVVVETRLVPTLVVAVSALEAVAALAVQDEAAAAMAAAKALSPPVQPGELLARACGPSRGPQDPEDIKAEILPHTLTPHRVKAV